MSESVPRPPSGLTIAGTERDTGLSKDTLRVWERRYGFPAPLRDAAGERLYPVDQIDRLRILKRLVDVGHRPRHVVSLPLEALQRLALESPAQAPPSKAAAGEAAPGLADLEICLDCLRDHDVDGLRRQLRRAAAQLGLAGLVTEVIAPLNTRVGEAWMRGQLEIFEEHLYTELVQSTLRQAIEALPPPAGPAAGPRVLLTTCAGEPHGLGLLMAEAMLALEGARCVSLGVATPVWDIVLAAKALKCDIVALSFTGCMNPNHVVDVLTELRSKLPARVDVWAGGAAPALHRRPVSGVVPLAAFGELRAALQAWRSRSDRGTRASPRP